MKRRALVIGAGLDLPANGPAAEDTDAECMARMLSDRYGFEVTELRGAAANRKAILASYRKLIADVNEGDAAVVYYAGHGGVVCDAEPRREGCMLPRRMQYIAPTDYKQSTDDDFRGISAWELSLLLGQLTAKTDNVTVILDCCHAAQMSRDHARTGTPPRAIPRPFRIDMQRHYYRVRQELGTIDRLHPGGNPKAVRLVACGDWQCAYPTRDELGRPIGLFTHELLATLGEIGDTAVPWRAIHAAVSTRVLRKVPAQRPIVEGPARRQPFSVREIDRSTISIAKQQDELLRLDAGQLAGVAVGDIYGVTRFDAPAFTAETSIARVRVEQVAALHAIARPIEWFPGHSSLPGDTIVWPLELTLARQPVRITGEGRDRPALEAAIACSRRLRIAEPGERAVGELQAGKGGTAVIAGDGRPIEHSAGRWTPAEAVQQLEQLAAAQGLRELEGEHGIELSELDVEWGVIQDGERIRLPEHGAALGLGDRFYLRLTNRARSPRFAHVFNIGLRGRISRLSQHAPLGIWLGPGKEELATPTPDPTAGFTLFWPKTMPRDEPGTDTLMVIVTTRAADLQALETDDRTGTRGRVRAAGSPLQRLVSQLHEGGTRSAAKPGEDPFCVVRRSYVLHPLEAAIGGPPFAIDEDPLAVHAALRPEVWLGGTAARARPVEVRLRELAVERAVRIDTLVLTRSADPARIYQARTLRVPAGGTPDRIPPLWRGPVRDLLDVYVWIAPDPGGMDLTELVGPRISCPELADCRNALTISEDLAAWSLAGGASRALARAAGALLRGAVAGVEGLLHTSFAAHERYGIGDQPATGLYRATGVAGDVAFGLAIVDLEKAGG